MSRNSVFIYFCICLFNFQSASITPSNPSYWSRRIGTSVSLLLGGAYLGGQATIQHIWSNVTVHMRMLVGGSIRPCCHAILQCWISLLLFYYSLSSANNVSFFLLLLLSMILIYIYRLFRSYFTTTLPIQHTQTNYIIIINIYNHFFIY